MTERVIMRACLLPMLIVLCGSFRPAPAQIMMPLPTPSFPQMKATVLPLGDGADLITLQAITATGETIPILSVLRDTLGDEEPDNDLMRYVWIYTYAPPTVVQRLTAFIPFLYHPVTTRRTANSPPPMILDLSRPGDRPWQKVSSLLLQNLVLDGQGWMFRVLPRTNRKNLAEYREAQIAKALVFLSLYEKTGDGTLSPGELTTLRARLKEEGILPSLVGDHLVAEAADGERHRSRERKATNWDLLRQRAEEEGLFFEPLGPPGEPPSHALLWVAKEDVARRYGSTGFNKKFLNIANPWTDTRLLLWDGYSRTIYLNDRNERVSPDAPGARLRQLIPLALYGLDFPRIPILLVDFRNALNVKARAASGRTIDDSARYVFNLSPYGDLGYFLARSLTRFVTRRKGIDLDQPSRLRALAELRAVLLMDASLPAELKSVVARKAEFCQVLPIENTLKYQPEIARAQHAALVRAATADAGPVGRRLEHDRQHEYRRLVHGRLARALYRLAHYASLGLYDHHEDPTAELTRRYRIARKLAFHKNRLRAALRESVRLEQDANLQELVAALQAIHAHPSLADAETAALIRDVFYKTEDDALRRLCLSTLAAVKSSEPGRVAAVLSNDHTLSSLINTVTANRSRTEATTARESGSPSPTSR